jgi:hypothetical protein
MLLSRPAGLVVATSMPCCASLCFIPRHARFGDGGYIRQRGGTLRGRGGKKAQLAVTHLWQELIRRPDEELEPAVHQIGDHRGRAFVRHVVELDPSEGLAHRCAEMLRAAVAGRAVPRRRPHARVVFDTCSL